MYIKDLPHVTVEQVLALRKAVIELEIELQESEDIAARANLRYMEKCKELDLLKQALPKIKADAVLSLIEAIEGEIDNDFISLKEVEEMHLEDFCELAKRHANKLEAGE